MLLSSGCGLLMGFIVEQKSVPQSLFNNPD